MIAVRLYLDCSMGASGSSIMAALYELLPDKDVFRDRMEKFGIPGVTLGYNMAASCGVRGTRISVNARGKRYEPEEILDLLHELDLPLPVFENASGVFSIMSDAEDAARDVTINKVRPYELGSPDCVACVIGCSLLVEMLGLTEIEASPVHTGLGSIRYERGILPIPAPVTAEILKGVPIFGGLINEELCTPAGAAILKHFVSKFSDMRQMKALRIGYGMSTGGSGTDICLRAFLLHDDDAGADRGELRSVYEICCLIDDMTPESIGEVLSVLLENKAIEVYTTPVTTEKNRPATMLFCLSDAKNREKLAELIMRHTSALGVRTVRYTRNLMPLVPAAVSTTYGDIRVNRAEGYGITKYKPLYDDVIAAAYSHVVPFVTVYETAKREAELNAI